MPYETGDRDEKGYQSTVRRHDIFFSAPCPPILPGKISFGRKPTPCVGEQRWLILPRSARDGGVWFETLFHRANIGDGKTFGLVLQRYHYAHRLPVVYGWRDISTLFPTPLLPRAIGAYQ